MSRRKSRRKSRRIVITGSKGGTGVSIVSEFRKHGYDVLGIDLVDPEPMEEGYRRVDLLDGAAVHDALAGAAGVVHFGSFPGDSHCAWDTCYRNVALGGFHVFQACANLGIRRIAHASSPNVYGSPYVVEAVPVDETRPQRPSSIYGAAKQNLEALASNYCRWFPDMAIAALRTCRIVYEGTFSWRLQRHTEDPASAADCLWSYVDARDVAAACRLWIESDLTGFEAFDVAAADVCFPLPTAELVRRHLPRSVKVRGALRGSQALVHCRKLRRKLGWRPQYGWREMREEERRNDEATEGKKV